MSNYIKIMDSLETYLNEEKYNALISELLETLLKELVSSIKSNLQYKELQYLEDYKLNLYRIINKYQSENAEIKKIFSLAYMKAILDIKIYSDKDNLSDENSIELLKSHKRLSSLIECLYNENALTHQELADRMQISKSNLSNLVNKPEVAKLITKSKYSKKVYYSISNAGHKLYKYVAINKSKYCDAAQYTEFFIQMIDSLQMEINSEFVSPTRFWNNFISVDNGNMVFTKSHTIKNKLNKLLFSVKKQKPYNSYVETIKIIDDKKEPNSKVLRLHEIMKGDIYGYFK